MKFWHEEVCFQLHLCNSAKSSIFSFHSHLSMFIELKAQLKSNETVLMEIEHKDLTSSFLRKYNA